MSLPLPVANALLLADCVIVEAGSGKKTLVGVYTSLRAGSLPARRRLNIFAELTDAAGVYSFDCEVEHLDAAEVIARASTGPVRFTDRLEPVEMVVKLPVRFLDYGVYELRLSHADRLVAARTFRLAAGAAKTRSSQADGGKD